MNSDQNQFKAKKTSPSFEFEGEEKEKKTTAKKDTNTYSKEYQAE